jgi:hypothetical protein
MNYVIRRSPTSTSYWREDALTAEWTTRTFATVFDDDQSARIIAKFREHFAPDALRRPAEEPPVPAVPPSTDQPMKYVIKKSPVSTDSLSWWNCESSNWDIRSKATAMFIYQAEYIVSDLRAARIAPDALRVLADESPAYNLPPPADNVPPPADKDASPTKDQTMRIDLGIQAHWSSGNCHGCGRHYEIPGVLGTDLTWPFLTLHLQAYTDKEKREEITIQAAAVLCPDCSKAINNAFEHNRWILNQVNPPPADKAPSPITAPEAASPAEESKVDELIREAEAAITGGASVARPLPILIAKLLRELKGERATCLLQRIALKDLRAKLAQMPKEERWGIWFSNTKSWFLDYSDMAGGAQIMTWSSKGAAVSFAKQSQLAPPYVIRPYNPSAPAPEDALPTAPKASEAAETYTFSLRIAQLFLSQDVESDRLYALDVEGRVWTWTNGSEKWEKLPSLEKEGT